MHFFMENRKSKSQLLDDKSRALPHLFWVKKKKKEFIKSYLTSHDVKVHLNFSYKYSYEPS